ncbi:MAG: hypothetical protein A2756_04390 [Candidatus Ryanbacteria bacterium RIFCSPHIGHO2_01_FULL_48_27]|uniref:M23ase beta-sheet core domain-containing protein n=1 Tax=Candidatus Ryanbacteria bacterium RIFCSPHIGHO2_01_FULL_48_27 TaxID=1802115 RepID=A0A1G2G301_9BACT|nr:MAG: hypothetical protein A2756_04390 [Candidatus Ryanbacteria bacterium RIFCSPHIGHO2_01_FULL_48_27]
MVPETSVKNTDGYTGSIWDIRSTVEGNVTDVERSCVVFNGTDDNVDERNCHHGFGNTVVIRGFDSLYYGFHHMVQGSIPSGIYLGATVSVGQKLGVMGNTGFVDGIHLHLSVWRVDPRLSDKEPAVEVKYKPSHPANFGSIDPFTLLTTPTRKLLFVSAPEAKIRRGPGTKYSVFAKALKYQGLVAFASVYAEDRTWYRIPQPCSSRSSCAGWIAQDGVTVHEVPTNFPYLLQLNGTYNGTIHADTIPITITSDPFKGSGGIGQEYLYLARVPSTKTTCACWYALAKPQYVDSLSAFAWMCGGDNTNGDWTNPPCSMSLLNGPNQTLLNFDGLFPADARVAGVTIYADPLPTLNDPLPPLVDPVDLAPPDLPPPPSEPVPIPPPTLAMTAVASTETSATLTVTVNTYGLVGMLHLAYGSSSLHKNAVVLPERQLSAYDGSQTITISLTDLACETMYYPTISVTRDAVSYEGTSLFFKTQTCTPDSLPYDDGTRVDSIDAPEGMIARFVDTFTTGALDTTRWPQQGGSRVCTTSTCKASDDGYAFSQSFTIDPAQPITLIRRVRLHGADPIMRFMVGSGGNPGNWGIFYGNGCMQLYRDHAAPESDCRARSEVSTSVSLPDRLWITERMEWDPVRGHITLYIDDLEQTSLTIDPLPAYLTDISVGIQAGGASSGQSQETDYLVVLQPEPNLTLTQNRTAQLPTKQTLFTDSFEEGSPQASLWSTVVSTTPVVMDDISYASVASHVVLAKLESVPITLTPAKSWEVSWRDQVAAAPGDKCTQYVEIVPNTGSTYAVAYQRGDYKPDDRCPVNPGDAVIGYVTKDRSCAPANRTDKFGYPNRIWKENLLTYDPSTQELIYTVDGIAVARMSAPNLADTTSITLRFHSGMEHPQSPNGQQFILDQVTVRE